MKTRPVILAVRPRDRWTETRAAFASLPVELTLTEVLAYAALPAILPPPADLDGLIVTSARAVDGVDLAAYRHLPAYVVGERAADALKEQGFVHIAHRGQDGAALAAYLRRLSPTHYLYLRGDVVAVDFNQALQDSGGKVTSVMTYQSAPISQLDDDIIENIRGRKIDGVLFFSGQSARVFVDLAREGGLADDLAHLSALCLSEAVLGSIHTQTWAQTIVAATPDLSGMVRAVSAFLATRAQNILMDTTMTDPHAAHDQRLADTVIDRFGGIRPMATKTGIAVTTVQGWKKRGLIPLSRMAQITQAALTHGVDLSDLTPTNDLGELVPPAQTPTPIQIAPAPAPEIDPPAPENKTDDPDQIDMGPVMARLRELIDQAEEQTSPPPFVPPSPVVAAALSPKVRAASNTSWIAVMIVAVAVLVGLLAMIPGARRLWVQEQRLAALERELTQTRDQVKTLQGENALLAGAVPDEVKVQLNDLANRAEVVEAAITGLGRETQALTAGVMGDEEGTMERRLATIEDKMTALDKQASGSAMLAFVTRLQDGQKTPAGQKIFARAALQMLAAAGEAPDFAAIEPRVRGAFKTAPEMKKVFDGLATDDLRGAMMLAALADLRRKMATENARLDQNIGLLRRLGLGPVLTDDFVADLDRLQEDARDGLVTFDQVQRDFQILAPKIVAASLAGEGVSFSERARARLHDVLRIDRGGVPMTGTKTQRAVEAAKRALARGDVSAALAALQPLDGAAAAAAASWGAQAESYLLAQNTLDQLTKIISVEISARFSSKDSVSGGGVVTPDQIVQGITRSLRAPSP